MSGFLDRLQLQRSDVGSGSLAESTPLAAPAFYVQAPRWQAIETGAVALVAIATVRLLHVRDAAELQWFLIPCVLVIAALVPTWIARRDFPPIGLSADHLGPALRTVLPLCLCVLPAVYVGMWLLASAGLPIPLRPAFAGRQNLTAWLLYQFLYVATAEEVFFRGYVQANAMRLLRELRLSQQTRQWIAILISAGCFALAHVAVQGQIASAVTFLPGLLLAWLFARTHSLLASILFHGLANASYGIMALTFA